MDIKGKYANSSIALKQGIVIDLQKRIYVIITTLFGLFRFRDKPKPLPPVNYILLFRTLYNKCQSCNIADFENDSVIQLSLVYDKNKKLIVHEGYDMQYMLNLARQLSAELKVDVKDAATDRRKPRWLLL